jgi:hypothetical protein
MEGRHGHVILAAAAGTIVGLFIFGFVTTLFPAVSPVNVAGAFKPAGS